MVSENTQRIVIRGTSVKPQNKGTLTVKFHTNIHNLIELTLEKH